MTREIHWPTVALVACVALAVVAIFAFGGPAERVEYLSILSVLGTSLAAVMRAAFGAPKSTPKRLGDDCPVTYRGADGCDYRCGALHAAGARACVSPNPETKAYALRERDASPPVPDDDDDDPGEGGEVLAEEPPTKPLPRAPRRVTLSPRAMLAMLPFLALGCSPSALQTHATIASVTGHVFDTACAEVETARSREQHAIADGLLDRDESRVAVDAVRAHWAPALASCELAADTHDAWVTTLALAAAGAPFTLTDGVELARRALSVWQSLTAVLMIAGVGMPAVPPELVALVGGGL